MDIVRRALSWCWFLLRLKGTQSADAHVQKIPFLSWFEYPKTHVNRKWVAHPEHVNKCCGVRQILQVTITIIDPRLYQSTQFLCTTWNSPMNLFREIKAKHWQILPFKESLEVRNETKSESLSKVQDQESLIYQISITFLHWFSKYVHV